MSKKCTVIDYIEEAHCTVCGVSRNAFYNNVSNFNYFIGCQTSNEKYEGDYLTLIKMNSDCYSDTCTYRITEREVFDSFQEVYKKVEVEVFGCEYLSSKGFEDRMRRLFEPDSEYEVVVFKLQKLPFPFFNDPPINKIARKRIKECEANEKYREYFIQINRFTPLSEHEEQELAIQAISGDKKVQDSIAVTYLKTVVDIAKHYVNCNHSLENLISIGNVALIHAAKTLDKAHNSQIRDYICWEIRRKIMIDASDSYPFCCKYPIPIINKINKFSNAQEKLRKEYKYEPIDEELAKELSWSIDTVNDFLDCQDEVSDSLMNSIKNSNMLE